MNIFILFNSNQRFYSFSKSQHLCPYWIIWQLGQWLLEEQRPWGVGPMVCGLAISPGCSPCSDKLENLWLRRAWDPSITHTWIHTCTKRGSFSASCLCFSWFTSEPKVKGVPRMCCSKKAKVETEGGEVHSFCAFSLFFWEQNKYSCMNHEIMNFAILMIFAHK